MTFLYPRVRKLVIHLAIHHPVLMSTLFFFFLLTLANHIQFATGMAIKISPFWQFLLTGAAMAFFGASLLYEVIRLYRDLLQVQMVSTISASLHHEINNPLNVIQLSAEKLQALKSYDETTVSDILAYSTRIQDVVVKLSELKEKVRPHKDPGFGGIIDVSRSQ